MPSNNCFVDDIDDYIGGDIVDLRNNGPIAQYFKQLHHTIFFSSTLSIYYAN